MNALFFCCTLLSCASLTPFEEGRTMGKDNYDLKLSVNFGEGAELLIDTSLTTYGQGAVSMSFGATENIDVGGRIDVSTMMSGYSKMQIIGNKSSIIASSILAEIGIAPFGVLFGSYRYFGVLGVCNTIYIGDYLAINVSPRLLYAHRRQFDLQDRSSMIELPIINDKWHVGVNYGLRIGKKNRLMLEVAQLTIDKFEVARFGVGYGYVIE